MHTGTVPTASCFLPLQSCQNAFLTPAWAFVQNFVFFILVTFIILSILLPESCVSSYSLCVILSVFLTLDFLKMEFFGEGSNFKLTSGPGHRGSI